MAEPDSFLLTGVPAPQRPRPSSMPTGPQRIPPELGANHIADRASFEGLARRDDVPGALGVREVKFLMTGVNAPGAQLFFINTKNIVFHYDFAVQALQVQLSIPEFNSITYFRDDRVNLAGTLLAHDQVGGEDATTLYALEFWPTDPVRARHVALAFHAITEAMPFARGQIAYHPAGDTQEALYETDRDELTALGVRAISTTELFADVTYSPLNLGVGYGLLRVVAPKEQPGERPPSLRDVPVFTTLPNDLAHVGGVISETPQTPLSHVNLRAKQNDTPNAYVKDASRHPRVMANLSRVVRYEVTADDFSIREATDAEVEAHLEKLRPAMVQRPVRDLTVRAITDLSLLRQASTSAFGAKAANVGELRTILAPENVPDGFAIPFRFYDDFMTANGLYDVVARMLYDAQFKNDVAYREQSLKDLRDQIKDAEVPQELVAQIGDRQTSFPKDQSLRCRSSTNNEDLEGFNGAGLYDSYTHRPDEGHPVKTVQQVWASLWNLRAYEERDFYRVNHFDAAMGVLVHPNYDDELANGVAITKNLYDPNWPGFYVNVQVGESLVTNPDPNATPDELLISAIGPQGEYEVQYIRHSSEVAQGDHVLTRAQIQELTNAMEKIQAHFVLVYDKEDDPSFAMDIEFKIDATGHLIVKQARPWVE